MSTPIVPFTGVAGWVLQGRRDRKRLTQAQVAAHLDVSTALWAKIEKGLATISVLQLMQFADLLQEPASDVLRDIEFAMSKCQSAGQAVLYDKPPAKVSDASNFLLGAALAGLLATILLKKG